MSQSITIPPHGGKLVDRVLGSEARKEALDRASSLRRVALNARTMSDLELIAIGAYSPLEGFMGEADYRSVIHDMRLAGGSCLAPPDHARRAAVCRRHLE